MLNLSLNKTFLGHSIGLVVRGKHWLQFEIGGDAAAAQRHRFKAQELFMDSILSFIPTTLSYEEWHSKFNMYFSAFEVRHSGIFLYEKSPTKITSNLALL